MGQKLFSVTDEPDIEGQGSSLPPSSNENPPGMEAPSIENHVLDEKMCVKLFQVDNNRLNQWDEKSRFFTYQEDLLRNSEFGEPFVSFNFFDGFRDLRAVFERGSTIFDHTFVNILGLVHFMSTCFPADQEKVGGIIARAFKHRLFDISRPRRDTITRSISTTDAPFQLANLTSEPMRSVEGAIFKKHSTASGLYKSRDNFTMKTTISKQQAVVMTGGLHGLEKVHLAILRFTEAVPIPEISGDMNPIKLVCFLVGPVDKEIDFLLLGKAYGSVLATKNFQKAILNARGSKCLVTALEHYLNDSIVIGPTTIFSRKLIPTGEIRRQINNRICSMITEEMSVKVCPSVQAIEDKPEQSQRFVTKAFREVKARSEVYISDYTDAYNWITVGAIINMFFTHIGTSVSFGGLMGEYTENRMGMSETLMAQCFVGLGYSVTSVQPMLMVGPTGPVLIFENAFIKLCEYTAVNVLDTRWFTGFFFLVYCILFNSLGLTRLSKCITRFTDDSFNMVISVIFMAESFKFLYVTAKKNPVLSLVEYIDIHSACVDVILKNGTAIESCMMTEYQPNTFFASMILLAITFTAAALCNYLSRKRSLIRQIRGRLGNFKLAIAILVGYIIYTCFYDHLYIQLLDIPEKIEFINPRRIQRGFLIYPKSMEPKVLVVSIISAFLLYILVFVETQITLILLSKPEFGLRKPSGLDWDMMIIGVFIFCSSVAGVPWMCPGAVQSIVHVRAMTIWKKTAPGERPQIDRVVEQRVTGIMVYLLIGIFDFFGSHMTIPVAALFGVFLFLGIYNMVSLQLTKRILLLFVAPKYYPNKCYAQVRVNTLRLYTFIQVMCVVTVVASSAVFFPFVLLCIIGIRQFVLPKLFTEDELEKLDSHGSPESDDPADNDPADLFSIPV